MTLRAVPLIQPGELDDYQRDLGARFRDVREAQGLTQQQLADIAEISCRRLAEFEAGANTSLDTAARLSCALGFSPEGMGLPGGLVGDVARMVAKRFDLDLLPTKKPKTILTVVKPPLPQTRGPLTREELQDMEEYVRDFGARVENEREGQELTQQHLADIAGISRKHLLEVEAGANTSTETAARLCLALGLSLRGRPDGLLAATARVIAERYNLALPKKAPKLKK